MTGRVKGRHVLGAILLFFGVVIAINVGFAIAAIRSFPGEDERRSYLQGLRFNDTLAERRAQRLLGWRAATEWRAVENGSSLRVVMRTRDGAPIDGLAIQGVLGRRSSAAFDHPLDFTAEGRGAYVATLPTLAAGQWRLRARAANTAGNALDFESDLTWP